MTEHTHQECPKCGGQQFSWNDETNLFNCFSASCRYSGKGLYSDGKITPLSQNKKEEEGMTLEPYIPEEGYRGISPKTLEKYGVYFTKHEGKETVHYTYNDSTTKHRELPKTIRISGKMDTFYGQEDYNGSGRNITITEGEEDRLSVIEMMGDWPTVSVPGATPSKAFWENARQYLAGFDQIKLSVDNDEAGDKLADKFYRMFPNKVYRVSHTKYKDANEFLQKGAKREYKDAWWSATKVKPSGFISTADDWVKAIQEENPYEYVPTPVDALNKKIKGFIKGGITVIKAPPGTGKTSVFRLFEHHLMKNTDTKIAILHMEDMRSTTGRGMATYELGVNVNTKEEAQDNGVDEETVMETVRSLVGNDRFITFDIDNQDPINDTIEKIRLCREVYEVDFIFLDHLQRLAYLSGVESATSELTQLAVQVVDMTRKDPFGFIAISHVNNEGATKYAKSVEEEAIVVIDMSRDKQAEDPDERDTTYIDVTKNRPFGQTGSAGELTYDHESTMVYEKGSDAPVFDNGSISKEVGF